MELETGKHISVKLWPWRFETTTYVVDKDYNLTLPRGWRIFCSWNSPSNFSFLRQGVDADHSIQLFLGDLEQAQLQAANSLAIVKQKAGKEMSVYKSFTMVREMQWNKNIQVCQIA